MKKSAVEFTIRKATKRDFDKLLALWLPLDAMHHDLIPEFLITPQQRKTFLEAILAKKTKHQVWLAQTPDKEVIGLIMAHIKENKVGLYKKTGYIDDLHTNPKFRKMGVGNALLAEVLKFFKSKKLKLAELSVAAKNKLGKSYWNRKGFEPFIERLKLEL